MKLKRLVRAITFLGIACGAAVDVLKTVTEMLEDRNDE